MKRTVVDCDGCGKPDMEDYHTLEFKTGTQRDVASGRTEDVVETLEFCTGCLGRIAQEAIKTRPVTEQKGMYERWVQQKAEAKPRSRHGYAPAGVVFRDPQ